MALRHYGTMALWHYGIMKLCHYGTRTPGVPVGTSGYQEYQEYQDQISGATYISDVVSLLYSLALNLPFLTKYKKNIFCIFPKAVCPLPPFHIWSAPFLLSPLSP